MASWRGGTARGQAKREGEDRIGPPGRVTGRGAADGGERSCVVIVRGIGLAVITGMHINQWLGLGSVLVSSLVLTACPGEGGGGETEGPTTEAATETDDPPPNETDNETDYPPPNETDDPPPEGCGNVGDACDAGCCEGLACGEDGLCAEAPPACAPAGASCAEADCCEGLACGEDGLCSEAPPACAAVGEACVELSCCEGLACGEDGLCAEAPPACAPVGELCTEVECCEGLECNDLALCEPEL